MSGHDLQSTANSAVVSPNDQMALEAIREQLRSTRARIDEVRREIEHRQAATTELYRIRLADSHREIEELETRHRETLRVLADGTRLEVERILADGQFRLDERRSTMAGQRTIVDGVVVE